MFVHLWGTGGNDYTIQPLFLDFVSQEFLAGV
jgi:hypothetical protein